MVHILVNAMTGIEKREERIGVNSERNLSITWTVIGSVIEKLTPPDDEIARRKDLSVWGCL
jgi:hypothetical protein